MAKFSGKIGFSSQVEKDPGVWVEEIIERTVVGEVVKNYTKLRQGESGNTKLDINDEFRIVSSEAIRRDLSSMRYLTWKGVKWRITSIDPSTYPHITIQVGGVYNGNTYSVT